MKKILLFLLIIFSFSLSGCAVIEGIFKAGMVWGILLVMLIIWGILYLLTRGRGGKG